MERLSESRMMFTSILPSDSSFVWKTMEGLEKFREAFEANFSWSEFTIHRGFIGAIRRIIYNRRIMKIQYASDLHLEFADNWRFLKENPLQVTGDILVLAGDIGYLGDENYSKHPFWDWASENYQQVIACMGNHELPMQAMTCW